MKTEKAMPLRVLLVEDNEHDSRAFERALNKADIDLDLTVCNRAEEAESRLTGRNNSFQIVVTRYELPGMNGLDLYMKVRRQKNLPPFVVLAGAGSEKIAVKALQAGIYDYIIKDEQSGYLELLPLVLLATVQRFNDERIRGNIQAELVESKNELEQTVQKRTAELTITIQALENEIAEHRQTEVALRKSQVQLRELSRTILDAQENERKLVAQEIHDSIGGSLAAIKFALEEKLESMGQNPQSEVISLEKIVSYVDTTIKETRRISAHLRPSLLDDIGLLATISWFCREFEKLHPEMQIDQQLNVAEHAVPEMLKVVVYRVLQEALNNVGKHSEATRVWLQLDKGDNRLKLTVTDNGRGFDPAEKFSDSTVAAGFGLSGMRDRTTLCDGDFEIISEKGKGTTVHISLPCDAESSIT
ncbi:MAG: response regulator [Desulfobacterales bacterium]